MKSNRTIAGKRVIAAVNELQGGGGGSQPPQTVPHPQVHVPTAHDAPHLVPNRAPTALVPAPSPNFGDPGTFQLADGSPASAPANIVALILAIPDDGPPWPIGSYVVLGDVQKSIGAVRIGRRAAPHRQSPSASTRL